MTHTRKSPLQSLAAFAEAVAPALGLSPLQPWQKRMLDAIERKRRLDAFARYEPERDGAPPAAESVADRLIREIASRRYVGRVMTIGLDRDPVIAGLDLGRDESTVVTGYRRGGVWTIDRIDRHERTPEEVFVPIGRRDGPGHGGYFSTPSIAGSPTWVEELFRRHPVSIELRELPPIWPDDHRVRLSATIETSRLGRELKRVSRSLDLLALRMRVRRLDRGPIEGAGRLLLEVLIRTEYRKRRAFFGEPWKAAAARYADLQTLHRDLYGVPAEPRR